MFKTIQIFVFMLNGVDIQQFNNLYNLEFSKFNELLE